MAAVRHDGLERGGVRRGADRGRKEASERRAMQIIGVCFLLLAAYVLSDAIGALVGGKEPAWLVPLVA
jgi:hypothetical protein